MTACTRPGCTGTIVDGYCDVCGSPPSAPAFSPAAADAAVPQPVTANGPREEAPHDRGVLPGDRLLSHVDQVDCFLFHAGLEASNCAADQRLLESPQNGF